MGLFSRMFHPPDVDKLAREQNENGLIKALQYRASYAIRAEAARALATIGTAISVLPLSSALDDENSIVRANAAHALGTIGERLHLDNIFTGVSDYISSPHFYFHMTILMKAMEKMGFPMRPTIGKLVALLDCGDTEVQQNAREALSKMRFFPILEKALDDVKTIIDQKS